MPLYTSATNPRHKELEKKYFITCTDTLNKTCNSNTSFLDSMMHITEMTPIEREVFEIYKEYGNRCQTWQDFFKMFQLYDDEPADETLNRLKESVKDWKKLRELNSANIKYQKILIRLKLLMTKYKITQLNDSIAKNCKFSDLISAYDKLAEVQTTLRTNYSTFNPSLSDFYNKVYTSSDKTLNSQKTCNNIVNFLYDGDYLSNLKFVVSERIEYMLQLLQNDGKLFHNLKNFTELSIQEKTTTFQSITHHCSKALGIPIPKIVIRKRLSDPMYTPYNNTIHIGYDQIIMPYAVFCFFHEYNHAIDFCESNYSILTIQDILFNNNESKKVFSIYNKIHDAIPLEQASNTTSAIIDGVINHYLHEKS